MTAQAVTEMPKKQPEKKYKRECFMLHLCKLQYVQFFNPFLL